MLIEWQTFLVSQGARIESGIVLDFDNTDRESAAELAGDIIADLSFMSVITISGKDAATFLNGQFTTDVTQLTNGGVQHSAWCNPKGQIIANFIIARLNGYYYILLPRELQEYFLQRLRKYVLHAAVTITNGNDTLQCFGVKAADTTVPSRLFTDRVISETGLVCVPVPLSRNRWILIGTLPDLKTRWLQLTQQSAVAGSHYWQLLDILDGLPWITTATTETCLPQLLNLDQLQGLDYKKGCFPGQEIIARLHYRGQYTHRLFIAHLDTTAAIKTGANVYTSNKTHSIGTIINSAKHPRQGQYVLVTLEIDYGSPEQLRLEDNTARFVQISTPPYLNLMEL